jgi:putative membrane protein
MLTAHMAIHIAAMNMVAPIIILAARAASGPPRRSAAGWIGSAAAAQLALLWGWHLPDAVALAASSSVVGILAHATLFASALIFWRTIVDAADDRPWMALASLLITGKVFCLLGVLLAFAQRPLYAEAMPGMETQSLLADQQSAGLLMLIACPLSYVIAAVVISARWMLELESRRGRRQAAP